MRLAMGLVLLVLLLVVAAVPRIELSYGLLPLLHGTVRIDRVVLDRPRVYLVQTAEGWVLPEARETGATSGGSTTVIFDGVRIHDGRLAVAWREGERVRSLHLMSMGRAVNACARWRLDADPEALTDLREAVGWLSRRGNALFASLNYGWLADALAASGASQEARDFAAQALRRARGLDLLGASLACRAMCVQSVRAGRLAGAARWLEEARRWAHARDSRREQAENDLCAAELELACGRTEQATALLARADAAFADMDMQAHRSKVNSLQQQAGAAKPHRILAAG
jgi:hypothetical protein